MRLAGAAVAAGEVQAIPPEGVPPETEATRLLRSLLEDRPARIAALGPLGTLARPDSPSGAAERIPEVVIVGGRTAGVPFYLGEVGPVRDFNFENDAALRASCWNPVFPSFAPDSSFQPDRHDWRASRHCRRARRARALARRWRARLPTLVRDLPRGRRLSPSIPLRLLDPFAGTDHPRAEGLAHPRRARGAVAGESGSVADRGAVARDVCGSAGRRHLLHGRAGRGGALPGGGGGVPR